MSSLPIRHWSANMNWPMRVALAGFVLIFGTGCVSYHISAAQNQSRAYGWKYTSFLFFGSYEPIACDVTEQGGRARCWTLEIKEVHPPSGDEAGTSESAAPSKPEWLEGDDGKRTSDEGSCEDASDCPSGRACISGACR